MRLSRITYFFAAATMVTAVACSSGSDPKDASVGDDSNGGHDGTVTFDIGQPDVPVINKLCETNEQCQTENGSEWWACAKCATEWRCVQPGEMGDPAYGCNRNANCGSEKYCDPCELTCKTLLAACETCTEDEQCDGQMSHCVDSVTYEGVTTSLPGKICAPWCPLSTKVCTVEGAPQGSYVCAEIGDASNGVCVPATMNCDSTVTKCDDDSDCTTDGFTCYLDTGTCGCADALSCQLGQACHPVTHQCMTGCADDNECGDDKVCSQGLCITPCTGTLEKANVQGCTGTAPEGMSWDCDETGHCFIPGMCFQASDCTEAATFCNAETHHCDSGCMFDYDCKTFSQICDTTTTPGTCIRRPCKGNWSCACGEVCDLGVKECETAEGDYCATCDPQADQPCATDKEFCLSFQDDDGNDLGSFCAPPCSSDEENLCPQGWQCADIQNSDGSAAGKACVRACYQKVAGGCAMGDAPDPVTTSDGVTAESVSEEVVTDAK